MLYLSVIHIFLQFKRGVYGPVDLNCVFPFFPLYKRTKKVFDVCAMTVIVYVLFEKKLVNYTKEYCFD